MGLNLEGQNHSKPCLGFSGLLTRITTLYLQNFLGSFEGPNQGAKSAINEEKLGQRKFLERQSIATVGLWEIDRLGLVAFLEQTQAHSFQFYCTPSVYL